MVNKPRPIGSTLGILGGGQLGRMVSLAAARLGYKTHVYDAIKGSPGMQVSDRSTVADFFNTDALEKFSLSCDVVTYEFENIPLSAAEKIASSVPLIPSVMALAISQDRFKEKEFLFNNNISVAPYFLVRNMRELEEGFKKIGFPSVLKSRTMGYDGKGQNTFKSKKEIYSYNFENSSQESVLESWVNYDCEISVTIVRDSTGRSVSYDVSENQHKNHVLDKTIVPARISTELSDKAKKIAKKIAVLLNLEGTLTVEMFVVNQDIIVNEIAPRPHNSAHWTIDAARVSQFEQLVRVAMNLPLGSTDRMYDATMKNLLGKEINSWASYIRKPKNILHIYGKSKIKDGRKMGHVTSLRSKSSFFQ